MHPACPAQWVDCRGSLPRLWFSLVPSFYRPRPGYWSTRRERLWVCALRFRILQWMLRRRFSFLEWVKPRPVRCCGLRSVCHQRLQCAVSANKYECVSDVPGFFSLYFEGNICCHGDETSNNTWDSCFCFLTLLSNEKEMLPSPSHPTFLSARQIPILR